MPVIRIPRTPIIVPVNDLVQDDSIFKQQARYLGLRIVDNEDASDFAVKLYLMAEYYTLKNGAVGRKIEEGKGPKNYPVELTADNNSLVTSHVSLLSGARKVARRA